MAELPQRQRAALLLRTQQGLGYEDIAQALGTSVASVKSLLHRAREALLAKLGDLL
jgi:RNA polymerase sigma-70 factor (ECF subfamily)